VFAVRPPRSQYDVCFRLGNIPVRVHPFFWLVAVLLGTNPQDKSSLKPEHLLIWIAALFFSILLHELGHAAAIIHYGWRPEITLYAFGGLASYNPGYTNEFSSYNRSGNRAKGQIIISLAGPFAGFLFAGLIIASLYAFNRSMPLPVPGLNVVVGRGGLIEHPYLLLLVWHLLWINLMWGLVNLLPIYPLDGGQVSREVLLISNPSDGVRISLIVSIVASAMMAIVGIMYFETLFVTILFGLLAFNNFQMLQQYTGGYGGGRPW
jgi:stage IV sporulation protein FB